MNQEVEKQGPLNRLSYKGDLQPILNRASTQFGLGIPRSTSIIGIGYEDCNVILESERGKFLAKIFQKVRTEDDITRYVTIMEKTVAAGVNHPPLLKAGENTTVYKDPETQLSMVVMDFIEGETFFDLDRAPDNSERQAIIKQAALVNKIDYHPPYLFDSWAVPNIKTMFDKTKEFIEPKDTPLVEEVIRRYSAIPVDQLPHSFVHGDLTKANVLKGNDEKIYFLDFSCANWYPRIQELAVISANLLHDPKDSTSLKDKTEQVIQEYGRETPLTSDEKSSIYNYALAAVAMEFMGSHQEKFINGNDTEETEYWLNLGRNGLQEALAK